MKRRIDPQMLLKTNFKGVTKLKTLLAKTAQLKTLNKIKQNYAKTPSKFKENFIIFLNSLAFYLQTSFINFKRFLK